MPLWATILLINTILVCSLSLFIVVDWLLFIFSTIEPGYSVEVIVLIVCLLTFDIQLTWPHSKLTKPLSFTTLNQEIKIIYAFVLNYFTSSLTP